MSIIPKTQVVEYGGHQSGPGQRMVRLCRRHDTEETRERWVGSPNPNVRFGRHLDVCDMCDEQADAEVSDDEN